MKKLIVVGFLACAIVVSFAFMKDEPARYENLKVLPKNTTKQEMDSIMKHFTRSLGVRCTFCHVRNNDEQKNFNFASDENPHKGIAREMYKMTEKINKKYFKEDNEKRENMIPEMSCYSCHHGKEHPENTPPPPEPH